MRKILLSPSLRAGIDLPLHHHFALDNALTGGIQAGLGVGDPVELREGDAELEAGFGAGDLFERFVRRGDTGARMQPLYLAFGAAPLDPEQAGSVIVREGRQASMGFGQT